MPTTQNDLSYNHTKLDYQALLATARIAVGHSINQVSEYIDELRRHDGGYPHVGLVTEWLVMEAHNLSIAGATLHTLEGGLERDELEIVNKPDVKEK